MSAEGLPLIGVVTGRRSQPLRFTACIAAGVLAVVGVVSLHSARSDAAAPTELAAAWTGLTEKRSHNSHNKSHSSTSSNDTLPGTDDETPALVQAKNSSSSSPHIFLMLIDDQGYADMGYNNNGLDELSDCTPYMDSLAKDGVKLSQYYTQQLCTPARAALLTGKYPIHTGMQHDVIQPESPFGLPLSHKLMPAYLKEFHGYATHMIGKWHLGHYKKEYLPQARGFDNFYGYLSDQLWYYNHKSPHACSNSQCYYDMNHNGENAEGAIGVYSTLLFTDIFTQVLDDSDPATALFIYMSWQNVHAPLDAPPSQYFSTTELALIDSITDPYRRTFASMTLILDNAMKKVVGQVEAHGYYEDAVIIVASDNGGCSYSGGYNYPLRGGKQYLWEGGIRVNAFVHSPLIPASARGRTYDGLFHVTDWLPTIFYGMLHDSPDRLGRLDGVDHWRHLTGSAETGYPRHEILHNIDLWSLFQYGNMTVLKQPVQAIRVGDWKLLSGQDDADWYKPDGASCAGGPGYCTPSYEATDDCSFDYDDKIYLFNITADPYERADLASDYPEIVAQLLGRLEEFHTDMEDPAFRVTDYHKAYSSFKANNNFVGPFLDGKGEAPSR